MTSALPWLVLAALAAGPAVATGASPGPVVPDLSGRFKLNVSESDDARQKLREGMRRQGERGARRGPEEAPPDLGEGREPGETLRAALEPPEEITISQTPLEIEVEALYGDLRVFRPDGKKTKAENGTASRTARWSEGALVVETKHRAGQRVREGWRISADGTRLSIEVRLEGGFGPSVTLHRVYDRILPAD